MARGIILAMEEYEGGMDDGQEVDGAELASATVETNDEANEITSDSDQVVDASDDANTVGEIRDQMEESVEEGEGMDETSAEIAEVAIEALASRLGYPYYGRVLPAKESFGGRTSRIQATRIAIEKADNIFVRAWDAIVKTVKKIINKVVGWFRKLFDNTKKLQKAAEKMKVDYGDKAVSPAFTSSTAKNMGKVEDANDIIEFINDHSDMINGGMKEINGKAKDLLKKAKEKAKAYSKAKAKDNNQGEIRGFVKEILAEFTSLVKSVDNTGKADEGFHLWGNRIMKVSVHSIDTDSGPTQQMSKEGKGHFVSVEFIDASKLDPREGGVTIKAWNSGTGSQMKTALVKLSDTLASYTKESRKFEELQKEVINIADDLASLANDAKEGKGEKEDKKDFERITSTLRTTIVDLTNFVAKVNTTVCASASNTINGVLAINSENAKCWSKK